MTDKQLALEIVVANATYGLEVSEVYDAVEKELPEAKIYRLDSSKVNLAAIEFIALFGAVGSVVSIAEVLWRIYDTKIRPKKKGQEDTCGLYIAIDPEIGLHWWIGKDFLDENEFIKDFTMKVEKYMRTDRLDETYERIKFEVCGDIWIRRK